ncbi:MAG: hypothetical protein OXR62_00650 [Ahrensia sp.]|nr:hypothetical protein [Ahrensia sp.]
MSNGKSEPKGIVERAIFFIAGCGMGVLGVFLAWQCYQWAISPFEFPHRWLWCVASGGLSFFLLRGAWFTVMPEGKEDDFEVLT